MLGSCLSAAIWCSSCNAALPCSVLEVCVQRTPKTSFCSTCWTPVVELLHGNLDSLQFSSAQNKFVLGGFYVHLVKKVVCLMLNIMYCAVFSPILASKAGESLPRIVNQNANFSVLLSWNSKENKTSWAGLFWKDRIIVDTFWHIHKQQTNLTAPPLPTTTTETVPL